MSELIIIGDGVQKSDSPSPISIEPTTRPEPMSPRSATITLHQAMVTGDHEAVENIAQNLLQTVRKRDEEHRFVARLLEERTRELLDLQHRIEGSKPVSTPPPGFELNGVDKALYFLIPIQEGYSQSAHWVQRLPDGQGGALPEHSTPNQKPYVGDLYVDALLDEDKEPPRPFPVWLHDALVGPAGGCLQIFNYANTHLSWGAAAELQRYRQAHIDISTTKLHIESLEAQIRCCQEVQAAARGRMEMAYMEEKLSHFRTVGHAYGRPSNRLYARRVNYPTRKMQSGGED